jgi:membrane protein DedA with SNARE-associated domain
MLVGLGFLFGNQRRGLSIGFLLFALFFTVSGWVFSGMLIPGISDHWQSIWIQFVFPLAALGILYWSRWWVIRQEKFSEDHFSLE